MSMLSHAGDSAAEVTLADAMLLTSHASDGIADVMLAVV
jgi:hypothetical protein